MKLFLNEAYTSADMYNELVQYVYDILDASIDNIAIQAASEISDYDPEWCADPPNYADINRALLAAARVIAKDMLLEAPDVIHEAITEDRRQLAKDIRKGNLKHGNSLVGDNASEKEVADADAYDSSFGYEHATDGNTSIQLQDREKRTHHPISGYNYEKSPRISSHTWGRIWKNGELEKQFEGPKYVVRKDMADYLDSTGSDDNVNT